MYSNDLTLKCYFCQDECYSCVGSNITCTSCDTSGPFESYLFDMKCVYDCGDGYFKDENNGTLLNVCTKCDTACLSCEFNATYCYNCSIGYFFF